MQPNKLVNIASKTGTQVDRGIQLIGGKEASSSLGKIAFKTTKDMAYGLRFCLVLGRCETITFCCSTIKIIPFRGQVYIAAKIVSRGCMTFRNACVGEGC